MDEADGHVVDVPAAEMRGDTFVDARESGDVDGDGVVGVDDRLGGEVGFVEVGAMREHGAEGRSARNPVPQAGWWITATSNRGPSGIIDSASWARSRHRRGGRCGECLVAQLEVPSALTAVGSAVTPRPLADWLAVERSTMSRNLATLERDQLVETVERSPTGRCMSVTITERGRRTLGAAERAWRAVHDELRGALGDDVAPVLDAWLEQLEQPPAEARR